MTLLAVVGAVLVMVLVWLVWHERRLRSVETKVAKFPDFVVGLTASFTLRVAKEVDRVLQVKVDRQIDTYIADTRADLEKARSGEKAREDRL